ncbi:MAG TPA: alpha/beta hydrolase-fold protein, partial [Myxococcota bacterium]
MSSLEEMKTVGRWRSERLHRDVTLARWGHFGQPVLLFPTAGGDAEEVERMHLIGACKPLLDAGKIKLYSCDSVAGAALVQREGSAQHQMWLQNQFHHYIRNEVVPAIRKDCESEDVGIWAVGASIGAFHAVNVVCRFPDVFHKACAMSGTYDIRRFYDASHFNDDFWVSSALFFVPTLGGHHLEVLQSRYVLMPSGEGKAEDISESWKMANTLGAKGIPNRVVSWGREWPHDWHTWRKMLPLYLG